MTPHPDPAEGFGRRVLGPVVAEFCLRLWGLGRMMESPDDATLLFCARGGLRLQLVYERFLAASGLPASVRPEPFMVSRVVAIRPALLRTVEEDLETLVPAAAAALGHEFAGVPLADVVSSLSGVDPPADGSWGGPYTPERLAALLRHPDGKPVVDALVREGELFSRHLLGLLRGRRRAVLVDTGLYGTTRELLAAGFPELDVASVLMVRSFRGPPAGRGSRTVGLLVAAHDYSPWRRRTALLRYWHLVEWMFEPALPSVRTFTEVDGRPRSNLEIDGWQNRVDGEPGTVFAGVLQYVDSLPSGPAAGIVVDADRAWGELYRAIVWPDRRQAAALQVGTRSHDFGRTATWDPPADAGPMAALRGKRMWREGEIARSGSRMRGPLLAAVEAAYAARSLQRGAVRALGGGLGEESRRGWRWSR